MKMLLLDQYRQMMDPKADEVVRFLFESGYNPLREGDYQQLTLNSQEVPPSFPEPLRNFFVEIENTTPLYSEKEIKKGLAFFDKYAQPLLAMLGLASLPYCYAGAKGVQVLYFSERIRKDPEKRLTETGEFVFDVCNPKAFTDKGKGYRSIAKVRLMHAAIRYHLLKSDKWDTNLWDMPVNQEDQAGTNLAFSLISIRGLRKLGYTISPEEAMNYIKLWNWIGSLLGIEKQLLPNDNMEAYALDKAIADRNFQHSPEGVELTQSLLKFYKSQQDFPLPIDPELIMSYLLGDKVSKMLDLKTSEAVNTLINSVKGVNTLQSAFATSGGWHNTRRQFHKQKKSNVQPFRMVDRLND